MTAHTPLRCLNCQLRERSTNELVLLNTGSYPAFSSYLNQTWTWNGTDWTNASSALANNFDANGPLPARSQYVMSFDGTDVMVFGGQGGGSGQILNDTWLWNGTSWSKASPANSPFGRFGADADYVPGTGAVMFGGFGGAGNGVYLNETWVWSGTNWTQLSLATNPSARVGHTLATGGSTLVMFGGTISNGQILNDTWKFTGGAWSQVSVANGAGPSARYGASLAYDQAHSQWVMFGGANMYNFLPETWLFNGTTWTQASPANRPAGRVNAQIAWDSQSGSVIMFGGSDSQFPGYDANNETWKWDGTTWTQL